MTKVVAIGFCPFGLSQATLARYFSFLMMIVGSGQAQAEAVYLVDGCQPTCTHQRQIEMTDRAIDRLVYTLYNLTEEEIKIIEAGGNH